MRGVGASVDSVDGGHGDDSPQGGIERGKSLSGLWRRAVTVTLERAAPAPCSHKSRANIIIVTAATPSPSTPPAPPASHLLLGLLFLLYLIVHPSLQVRDTSTLVLYMF